MKRRRRINREGRGGGSGGARSLHTRVMVGECLLHTWRGAEVCLMHTRHLASKVGELVQIVMRRAWRVHCRTLITICLMRP